MHLTTIPSHFWRFSRGPSQGGWDLFTAKMGDADKRKFFKGLVNSELAGEAFGHAFNVVGDPH
jgi:hypothetical protein